MFREHVIQLDGVASRARVRAQTFRSHGLKVLSAELETVADEIEDIVGEARELLPRSSHLAAVRSVVAEACAGREEVGDPEVFADFLIAVISGGGYTIHDTAYVEKLQEENANFQRHGNLKNVGRVGDESIFILRPE